MCITWDLGQKARWSLRVNFQAQGQRINHEDAKVIGKMRGKP